MMDYVRRSELLAIEDIGRSRIIASISGDAAILTQASNMLSFSIQGPVLIGFVAGVFAAEMALRRDPTRAWASTVHALKGVALSVGVELTGALLAFFIAVPLFEALEKAQEVGWVHILCSLP